MAVEVPTVCRKEHSHAVYLTHIHPSFPHFLLPCYLTSSLYVSIFLSVLPALSSSSHWHPQSHMQTLQTCYFSKRSLEGSSTETLNKSSNRQHFPFYPPPSRLGACSVSFDLCGQIFFIPLGFSFHFPQFFFCSVYLVYVSSLFSVPSHSSASIQNTSNNCFYSQVCLTDFLLLCPPSNPTTVHTHSSSAQKGISSEILFPSI